MLKHIKIALHRLYKHNLYKNVSKNKKNINKMYFCMPPNISFYTTSTQHIDFIFCSNLVSPAWYVDYKYEAFLYTLYSPRSSKLSFKLYLYTGIQTEVQCK